MLIFMCKPPEIHDPLLYIIYNVFACSSTSPWCLLTTYRDRPQITLIALNRFKEGEIDDFPNDLFSLEMELQSLDDVQLNPKECVILLNLPKNFFVLLKAIYASDF